MQHIITDEEAARFRNIYDEYNGSTIISYKAALLDFLNNRPESTLGKLRPIAEMSEKPPEGCSRHFAYLKEGQWSNITPYRGVSCDTHFIDIQLTTPDPDAEERRQFEETMKKARGWPHDKFLKNEDGSYFDDQANPAWTAWKLAKAK